MRENHWWPVDSPNKRSVTRKAFPMVWHHHVTCRREALRWHHNGHDGVLNHQPHHCLLNRLFGCRSKKTSKLRITGLCAGNSPGTGEFPAQMASNAENVSIWWRHHGIAGALTRGSFGSYSQLSPCNPENSPQSILNDTSACIRRFSIKCTDYFLSTVINT